MLPVSCYNMSVCSLLLDLKTNLFEESSIAKSSVSIIAALCTFGHTPSHYFVFGGVFCTPGLILCM